MLYRTLTLVGLATVLVAGCRNSTQTPVDLSMGGDMATGGDMAKNYQTAADIKTMRQGAKGDFSISSVIAIAVSPMATSSPRVIIQDASGGDFSAILARCSPTSTAHMCNVATTVKTVAIGDNVSLQGTYEKSATTSFETFYIDMITVNSHSAALPAVASVLLTDITRNAMTKAKWFQHVTVSNPGTLVMYDFTPVEFKRTGATTCPQQFGFGLLPTGGTAATACTGMTQPPGVTTPVAGEVLIGTDFFMTYAVGSDCQCDAQYGVKTPTATSSTTVAGGILEFDTVFNSTPVVAYQYLAPLTTADVNVLPVN
jgi:hypothetical protein